MRILYHRKATARNLSATKKINRVIANENHYHLGGGNETDSHLHRGRSPSRTTWGIFQNQEGAIKDSPKTQRLYPNSKKFLDNFLKLRYNC